jgi:hypothetical protein
MMKYIIVLKHDGLERFWCTVVGLAVHWEPFGARFFVAVSRPPAKLRAHAPLTCSSPFVRHRTWDYI